MGDADSEAGRFGRNPHPAATDGFVRVPETKTELSEDELMDVLKKTSPFMTSSQYEALTITRWEDGIDIDFPSGALYMLAHFVLLAAAPQSGKKEDGWLPIDTAPKDGSTHLVVNDKGQVAPRIRDIIHNNVGTAHDWCSGAHATHWMPLPSPPSKAETP